MLMLFCLVGCGAKETVKGFVDDFSKNPIRINAMSVGTGKQHIIEKKMCSQDRGQFSYILNSGNVNKISRWNSLGSVHVKSFSVKLSPSTSNNVITSYNVNMKVIYKNEEVESYDFEAIQARNDYYWEIK
ncbi:hypothetical protein ACFL08_05555 [Patescibacteria group bacterium]